MPEQTIRCPQCNYEIQLTEAFTHRVEDRLRQQFTAESLRKKQEYDTAL